MFSRCCSRYPYVVGMSIKTKKNTPWDKANTYMKWRTALDATRYASAADVNLCDVSSLTAALQRHPNVETV